MTKIWVSTFGASSPVVRSWNELQFAPLTEWSDYELLANLNRWSRNRSVRDEARHRNLI